MVMKKIFYITAFTFVLALGTNVLAEVPMPVMNQINSQIFTPEATRPLHNLERDSKTNSEIIKLQEKNTEKSTEDKKDSSVLIKTPVNPKKEKTKFKDLFKGFTVDW